MSIFDDDGMSGLLGDDLNRNLNPNELPGGDTEDEGQLGGGEDGDEDGDDQKAPVKIEPKRRSVRNPRPRLTVDLLKGPRGIQTIENHFQDIKFAGKGHEKRDLNEIMRRLQHWGHRLYPNYNFDDLLANVERLSKKKPLQIHMNSYRQGLLKPPETNNENEIEDRDDDAIAADEPFDEFDALIGEQIAISKLAATTPRTPYSVRSEYSVNTNAFTTPKFGQANGVASTPYQFETPDPKRPDDSVSNQGTLLGYDLQEPGPSTPIEKPKLTSEQLAIIAENRRKAQERLKERQAARANASIVENP